MKLKRCLGFIPAALALVGTVFSANAAHANSYTWTGSVSKDWFNVENWSPKGIPGSADIVKVPEDKQITTSRSAAITVAGITAGPHASIQSNGAVTVSGTVKLVSSTWSGKGNTTFNGPLNLISSTWASDGRVVVNAPGTITNSVIAGNASFAINNSFVSIDSKFNGGPQTVGVDGVLKLVSKSNEGNKINADFSNFGKVIWLSGDLKINKNFTNNAGASVEVRSDGLLSGNDSTSFFANTGTLTNAGDGSATIDVPYDNDGQIAVESGTLEFAQNFSQDKGETNLKGGRIVAHGGMRIKGGRLTGTGTIDGDVSIEGGEFRPGHSPGSIVINGNYTQTSNGSLNMEIGGTSPGVSYDQVVVNGNAALAGTLNIIQYKGYIPPNNSNFELLTFFAATGNFSTVNIQYAPGVTFGVATTPISYIATAHVGTATPTPAPTATPKPTPVPTATPKPTVTPAPTDSRAPSVSVTAPTNNGNYTTLANATGTAADNVAVASVTTRLFRYATATKTAGYWAGGNTWTANYSTTSNERLTTGTTSWNLGLPALTYGKYQMVATAKDTVGNATQSPAISFVIAAGTSTVKLSTAAASSVSSTILLTFTGALDAVVARDISNYTVTITTTGLKIPVQSISIAGNTITLGLPPNSLKPADRVIAAWTNLFDTGGNISSGRSAILTAQ